MSKVILSIAVLALAMNYASAECNNMCSGHGVCGSNDMCTCYRNWRGNDCSERTCQFGIAFIDTPVGDLNHDGQIDFQFTDYANGNSLEENDIVTQWSPKGTNEQLYAFSEDEGHGYMECSNKGLCDRVSGECVCFDGYEGSACQRTVCPNACSGHGVCRNINDKAETISDKASYTYPLWDGLKNQACVCDPGWDDVDCHLRLCPKGMDPLDDTNVDEVQTITISGAGACTIKFTDTFGEVWETESVTIADSTAGRDAVEEALLNIPNDVIEGVTVAYNSPVLTVTFTHNAGDVALMTCDDDTNIVIAEATPGAGRYSECSGRGLCDYDTGICKCFRGYRLDDCSNQHALAFNADSF